MRTDWLLPLILAVLAVFWAGTGAVALVSLLQATEQLGLAGFGPVFARNAVEAFAAAGIALGLLVCWPRTAPVALWGMIMLSMTYVVAGSIWRRDLWADPLAPLLKMLPVTALALAALVMRRRREP